MKKVVRQRTASLCVLPHCLGSVFISYDQLSMYSTVISLGIFSILAIGWVLGIEPAYASEAADSSKATPALEAFALKDIRLLDSPWSEAQEANRRWLLSLEPGRLLHTFRLNAGLPSDARPYGGCEAPTCEIRGHSMGHYLSACAMMAAIGDDTLRQRSAYVVAELAKCQASLGNGYLSAFPESHLERLERHEHVWAPIYVIHKIMAGLYDQYAFCGNTQALDILKNMAGYFERRIDKLEEAEWTRIKDGTEIGGISETLLNLYSVTNDPEHLRLAQRFESETFLKPLAEGCDNRVFPQNAKEILVSGR